MADNKINLPGSYGGLMRYDSEYKSKFMLNPVKVIAFIAGIILFSIIIKVFWPVSA